MNLLKTLAITATLIISCNYLSAQKNETEAHENKWYIKETFVLNDTQSLGLYEHKESETGVLLVNNMGAVEWELPIKGCVMAISKYKDNFLVFYREKGYWSKHLDGCKIQKINAATLDIKSQKIIDDKVIYTGNKYIIPDFQKDPAGYFSQLLIRTTTEYEPEETKGITLITFNADGSAASKEIPSIATAGKFIGSSAGKDGSVFISSIQNGSSIAVEKFSHEGVLISKQESPINIRKKADYKAVMRTDTYINNNAVLINLKVVNQEKDKAFSYFRFNFDNNQVAVSNEAPLDKNSPYKYIRNHDELKPVDILYTNKFIILVRMVKFTEDLTRQGGRSDIRNHGDAMIVSVFDRQMKLLREVVMQKAAESVYDLDVELTAHINKDRLYILTGHTGNGRNLWNHLYNVNLNDGKYENKQVGIPESGSTMWIDGTFWFANEFIISHLHGRFSKNTVLDRVSYNVF